MKLLQKKSNPTTKKLHLFKSNRLSLNNYQKENNGVKVKNLSLEICNASAEYELNKAKKYFPSSTKEWFHSKYTYDRLDMRSVLGLSQSITKLVKAYLTSKPRRYKKRNTRRRQYMINKLYLSKPELKYTSNKITTQLYIFAEQGLNLTYLYRFLNKDNFEFFSLLMINNNNLLDLKNLIDNNTNRDQKLNYLWENKNKMIKLYELEKQLVNMKNSLEDKLSESFKIKQEIKLIRLKYLYLNNEMLSEYIALKLISKKRNLYRAKRKIFSKIKFPPVNKHDKNQFGEARKTILVKSLQNKTRINRGKIIWNQWKKNEYFRPGLTGNITKFKDYYKDFLNNIKYKFPVGYRLAIAGRLTRRNVASRSIKKLTYIGSIKDIDSSYKKLSVPVLRGHLKTSLEFAKFNSYARTGAFAVKSWLSKSD